MGKRPLVRRRGRGGMQFRAAATSKISPAKYPYFDLAEAHTGTVVDLVHESGRDTPLARVRFENGSISMIPAVLGTTIGSTINFGLNADLKEGNVISIQNIPDGTIVCNVEKHFGDGGAIAKSAGGSATWCYHKITFWCIYYTKSKESCHDWSTGRRWCWRQAIPQCRKQMEKIQIKGPQISNSQRCSPSSICPSTRRRTTPTHGWWRNSRKRCTTGSKGRKHCSKKDWTISSQRKNIIQFFYTLKLIKTKTRSIPKWQNSVFIFS